MKFHSHVNSAVSKGNRILLLLLISKRPLLEYGNLIWVHFTPRSQDQRSVESIQWRATRLVLGMRHLAYIDRLRNLDIPSLSYQRKQGDMISLYQIFQGHIKTHDSESRGQEEAGRTRRTSELFTRSTALKFVNALNKPP